MKQKTLALFLVSLACASVSIGASAQRKGQSISIQYGEVTDGRSVELRSGAVPGGAIVGGALGLASAKGKNSSKRWRNSIVGAAAGGAIAGAAQGDTRGMLYPVNLSGNAGHAQVVTDQREIRSGDCVAVERAGDSANLRRVSSAYCNEANAAAIQAVAEESMEEADECYLAKQAVVEATTVEEAELAAVKMKLLCDD